MSPSKSEDKATDKVDEISKKSRKSEVKSPRKVLLLRKTFEQSVFLPDSDSEFDESSKCTTGLENESLSMIFPDQTVRDQSNLGSPISDPRGMLSHGFRDQTIFLPYSDSETESSFIGNSVDVYQTTNHQNLSEAIDKTLASPEKTKVDLSHNTEPNKLDILSLNTGNESSNKMNVSQIDGKNQSVVNNRLFDSINDTMEMQEVDVSSQNKHVPTDNVQTDLTARTESSESDENKKNDHHKVQTVNENAMEVDFEESSNEGVLIINENSVETTSNEPIEVNKVSNKDTVSIEKDLKETESVEKGAEKEIIIEPTKQQESNGEESVKTVIETTKEGPKPVQKVTEPLSETTVPKESVYKPIESKEVSKKTEELPEFSSETSGKSSELLPEAPQSKTNVTTPRPRQSTRQTPLKRVVEDLASEDIKDKSPPKHIETTKKEETKNSSPESSEAKKTPPKPSVTTSSKDETINKTLPIPKATKSEPTDSNTSGPQVTPPKPASSDVINTETPRSGRGKRKQATPLVKEVLTAEATKTEVEETKNESTPSKGKAPRGEVETPTSLRRSARKASSTVSLDAATPVELTPTRRSTRKRTPSVSSETRYSLRNRTPSISSETSMVEDSVDPETTPVRPRRISTKGRTPSFDLEGESGTKKTPLKGGKARAETGKATATRRSTRSQTPNKSRKVSETDEYSDSDSDNDDRRSWQHERTRMTDFNLDSEDEEDVLNFEEIDETRLIVPEFLKTPGNKKSKPRAGSQETDEETEERALRNKRKSKIFEEKDAAGTKKKRMTLRPSVLGNIAEEKDAESGVQREPADKGTKQDKDKPNTGAKEVKTGDKSPKKGSASTTSKTEQSSNKEDSKKVEATKSSTEKESSTEEGSGSRSKRSSKTTGAATKLDPIAEVTKTVVSHEKKGKSEEKGSKKEKTNEKEETSGENPSGKEKQPQETAGKLVSENNEEEIETKPLSRRESRALFAARKSAKANASTASSASNMSRASNITSSRSGADVTRASSSVLVQSLLNSVKPESVSKMMQMNKLRRSTTTSGRGRQSRVTPLKSDEEEESEQVTTNSTAATKSGRTSAPAAAAPPGVSRPLRSRRVSEASTSSMRQSEESDMEVEEEKEEKSSVAVNRVKRRRDAKDSPVPVSTEEMAKKRKLTRQQTSVPAPVEEETAKRPKRK
uniref:Uncharacterized protein n=1 Tax=Cacopsylla melanoneura TaxID=428564 RepID=A0A8D8PXE0_9HEMI